MIVPPASSLALSGTYLLFAVARKPFEGFKDLGISLTLRISPVQSNSVVSPSRTRHPMYGVLSFLTG